MPVCPQLVPNFHKTHHVTQMRLMRRNGMYPSPLLVDLVLLAHDISQDLALRCNDRGTRVVGRRLEPEDAEGAASAGRRVDRARPNVPGGPRQRAGVPSYTRREGHQGRFSSGFLGGRDCGGGKVGRHFASCLRYGCHWIQIFGVAELADGKRREPGRICRVFRCVAIPVPPWRNAVFNNAD